ncbi:MAG: hypothetical protein Q9184_006279 [Pyrenodesmia sp. 2 TL-2023]
MEDGECTLRVLTLRKTAGFISRGPRRIKLDTYERNVDFPHPGSPSSSIDTVGESAASSISNAEMFAEPKTTSAWESPLSIKPAKRFPEQREETSPSRHMCNLSLFKGQKCFLSFAQFNLACRYLRRRGSFWYSSISAAQAAQRQSSMDQQTDYTEWSSEKLVERVTLLEKQLREQTTKYNSRRTSFSLDPKAQKVKPVRRFDPSKYSTRFIALKFAYLGQRYNGLEYHTNNTTPYPTIEEELWKALSKAKLIFPTPNPAVNDGEPNWEGCEYSKCGRTDKGVSAYGQVLSLRVRSNRPLSTPKSEDVHTAEKSDSGTPEEVVNGEQATSNVTAFDPIKDEIPYPQVLNRLLPPEIRILAWCPSPPPDFSARFSCMERRYKYFFTQPAYTPTPGPACLTPAKDLDGQQQREGWLDTQAMNEAAEKFKGSHDFRNFCKVDASKQIDNFRRHINSARIIRLQPKVQGQMGYFGLPDFQRQYPPNLNNESDPTTELDIRDPQTEPHIYAFEVHGSGFLWHQVRHMVAILFLIGQRLEKPSLVDDLLDIDKTPQKPVYDMADAAPLVLEDCKFEPELRWVYVGDTTSKAASATRAGPKGDGNYGIGGAVDELWKVWRRHKIDETLAGSLLDLVVRGHEDQFTWDPRNYEMRSEHDDRDLRQKKSESQRVFLGGDAPRNVGVYTPVMRRPRLETVEVVNAKYLKRKGLDPQERNRGTSMLSVDDE